MNELTALGRLARLTRRTRWSESRLSALRLRKLRALMRHAYTQVPYYRDLLDSCSLGPDDIQSLEDLERVPVTRREDILRLPLERRLAANADVASLFHHQTSGSTGVQIEICYSPAEHAAHSLLTLRSELAVGAGALRHVAHICQLDPPPQERWYQNLGILRRSQIDPLLPHERQLEQIRDLEPSVLVGFPFHLRLLAAKARSMGFDDLDVPFVFTQSERLTDEARELISRVFKARVHQRYDAWETYLIAWECERQDGFHIEHDHVVLECLDENGRPTKGSGELVVTNLDLFSTPLIRHSLGDLGKLASGPCACGSTFPRLAEIEGRQADIFRLPGGRLMSPLVFPDVAGLLQYRAVQEATDSVRLELVPAPGLGDEAIARIQYDLEKMLGPGVRVRILQMARIPVGPGGKHKYLISEVDEDAGAV